jgi:hypothetical protein
MNEPLSESAHYVTDRLGGTAVLLVQEGRVETPSVTPIRRAQDRPARPTGWARWLPWRRTPAARAAA